jgi:hypothetical protein
MDGMKPPTICLPPQIGGTRTKPKPTLEDYDRMSTPKRVTK